MKIMRDNSPRQSSGFVASVMSALILTTLVLLFSMFGKYDIQLWINFWPEASDWLDSFFLSNGSEAFQKLLVLFFVLFGFFFLTARLRRR